MTRWLVWAAALAVLAIVPLTLVVAPDAANFNAPMTQRIFYYHVPAAWAAYLAFFVTAAAGALDLWQGGRRRDAVALASAEVGTLFSLIALGTGLVWARQEFMGYSPVEDPKVVTLAVSILAYFAYFALRSGVDDPERRARLAAVYGVLAFVSVPLTYLASRASLHPDFARADESLDPVLRWHLLAATAAFTLLYAALVAVRASLARVETRLQEAP